MFHKTSWQLLVQTWAASLGERQRAVILCHRLESQDTAFSTARRCDTSSSSLCDADWARAPHLAMQVFQDALKRLIIRFIASQRPDNHLQVSIGTSLWNVVEESALHFSFILVSSQYVVDVGSGG